MRRRLGTGLAAAVAAAVTAATPAWPAEAPMGAGIQIPVTVEAFPLSDVRLGEGVCREAQEANRRYLHLLDPDRLLYTFRQNAGLPCPGQPLGGWEAPSCEVRGHFVGHFLSACALMVAGTGDEALKAKADALVAELARCQEALGNGYLSAYPEEFLDRLERMERVTWAPLYVTHKIMAGLLDMYQLTGNRQALDVLTRLAAFYKARADRLSEYRMERLLTVEFGGMSEVLHNLYAVTGDPAHLELAHRYDQAAFLGPLALERDNLSHLHGNTQIPKICGAARHYELTGDERYRTITRFFWDRVVGTRCYATGGTTLAEVWPEPNALADTLGANNQESCKTHNLLKVTRYLLRWTGDVVYADYYERAFFNGILGTQRLDNGQFLYYLPLASGLRKQWGTPYDSFWCCYGTGIESFAKLGDSIYFHDGGDLWVNLFIASTVIWRDRGVRVEQVTAFPEEEGTTLIIHAPGPARFGLRVRVPSWVREGASLRVNGTPAGVSAPGAWARLEREWRDGDRVEVSLPMGLHAAPMPDDPELVAVMYGPLVLAGIEPPAGAVVLGDPADPAAWVRRVEGAALRFRLDLGGGVTMIPLNQVVDEPYGVYWTVTREGSPRHRELLAQEAARRERDARTVDRVVVGDPESERAHGLQGQNHAAGPFGAGHWRHAPDGWFSWDLRLPEDGPAVLSCTYWGSDVPPRTFDILAAGEKIATQQLDRDRPGRFFDVEYPLPEALTRGRDRITVRFQAHAGNTAGGVFDCRVLRAAPGAAR